MSAADEPAAPDLSVAFPVFNEEANLERLHRELTEALSGMDLSYELVFVDDGSRDTSLAILKRLAAEDPRVRYVALSRNFGHQEALFAGLVYSRGRAVVTMDADLQHPPTLLPKLVELWRAGHDVVATHKRSYPYPWWRQVLTRAFYRLFAFVSGLPLSFGQSDFRLLDRKVVDVIVNIPEYRKFLRGLVEWVGFRQVRLEYDVQPRQGGKSKNDLNAMLTFALDGIVAFSVLPLRWIFVLGAVTTLASAGYAAVVGVLGLLKLAGQAVTLPPGWATVAAAIVFLGGVQLLALGILGEYVGRLLMQTRGRPTFVVGETSEEPAREPV